MKILAIESSCDETAAAVVEDGRSVLSSVVASQVERSQYQNRDVAMKMLISKLMEIKEREHLEKIEDIKGVQKEITWGSQIRSYVFMPYTLVKDHRTSFETGNVNAVMDGDLDGFINAYLKALSLGELEG